jgi:hypothetical protein
MPHGGASPFGLLDEKVPDMMLSTAPVGTRAPLVWLALCIWSGKCLIQRIRTWLKIVWPVGD